MGFRQRLMRIFRRNLGHGLAVAEIDYGYRLGVAVTVGRGRNRWGTGALTTVNRRLQVRRSAVRMTRMLRQAAARRMRGFGWRRFRPLNRAMTPKEETTP